MNIFNRELYRCAVREKLKKLQDDKDKEKEREISKLFKNADKIVKSLLKKILSIDIIPSDPQVITFFVNGPLYGDGDKNQFNLIGNYHHYILTEVINNSKEISNLGIKLSSIRYVQRIAYDTPPRIVFDFIFTD